MKMWSDTLEKIADEIIALIVVIATVIFIVLKIDVPQWWSTAFGLIISFFFARKAMKSMNKNQNEK